MNTITPLHLEMILWAHCSPKSFPNESDTVKEVYVQLQAQEILWYDPESELYKLTRKGEIFLDMILNTPYPVLQYVDPRGVTTI